jgi:hypothetical protein
MDNRSTSRASNSSQQSELIFKPIAFCTGTSRFELDLAGSDSRFGTDSFVDVFTPYLSLMNYSMFNRTGSKEHPEVMDQSEKALQDYGEALGEFVGLYELCEDTVDNMDRTLDILPVYQAYIDGVRLSRGRRLESLEILERFVAQFEALETINRKNKGSAVYIDVEVKNIMAELTVIYLGENMDWTLEEYRVFYYLWAHGKAGKGPFEKAGKRSGKIDVSEAAAGENVEPNEAKESAA